MARAGRGIDIVVLVDSNRPARDERGLDNDIGRGGSNRPAGSARAE